MDLKLSRRKPPPPTLIPGCGFQNTDGACAACLRRAAQKPPNTSALSPFARVGFKRIPKGKVTMSGPVDPARLLVAELVEGAFEGASGEIKPDWPSESTPT